MSPKKGATLVGEPAGFVVAKEKGPLLESDKARAGTWIAEIARTITSKQ